jgi:hypothetical protein
MTQSKYTGRGLAWAKKPITKRRAKRVARWAAGQILEGALCNWDPEDLQERFGPEGFTEIENHIRFLSEWLIGTGERP